MGRLESSVWLRLIVVVAVIAPLACGPKLIWYGHSPDRKRTVEVREDDGHQYVVVDGVRQANASGIAVDNLRFSSNSRRVAYASQSDGKWRVVVDGVSGASRDGIGEIVFSRDGQRLAYAALDGRCWRVVLDGRPGPTFDSIYRESIVFSDDGVRIAYVAARNQRAVAIIDGETGPAFDGIGPIRFGGNHHVGYLARSGKRAHVVINSKTGPAFARISRLVFTDTGRFAYSALSSKGWVVVTDGSFSHTYTRVRGLISAGDGIAYAVQDQDAAWVVFNDVAGPSFQRVDFQTVQLSRDGRHVIYTAHDDKGWHVVADDVPGLSFSSIGALAVTQTLNQGKLRIAYVGRRSGRSHIIIDGKLIAKEKRAANVIFSPDGTRLAYVTRQGKTMSVVVDSKRFSFALIFLGSIVFSHNSQHWAALTARTVKKKLAIVVDGKIDIPFDTGELLEIISQDPNRFVGSADGNIVRRIIASELERWVNSTERIQKPGGSTHR